MTPYGNSLQSDFQFRHRVSKCENHEISLSQKLNKPFLKGAIRRAGVQRSGTIITKSHMLLGFADDIDIIGINRRAVEEASDLSGGKLRD